MISAGVTARSPADRPPAAAPTSPPTYLSRRRKQTNRPRPEPDQQRLSRRDPRLSAVGRSTRHPALRRVFCTNNPLTPYRALLLYGELRYIYRLPYHEAVERLEAWLAWASRSRLKPFVKLARTI